MTGKTNYIDINKIVYQGENEFYAGEYIFTENDLRLNIGYPNFKKELNQFLRKLKIFKLTGKDCDKLIGTIIYNNPFFTYDLVSSPGF